MFKLKKKRTKRRKNKINLFFKSVFNVSYNTSKNFKQASNNISLFGKFVLYYI